jgi:chlorophyll synthase
MGVRSLPVQLGPERAAKLACVVMWIPQAIAIALLIHWELPIYAIVLSLMLALQTVLMHRLLDKPRERAPWYNATGTSLYVLGMLLCAFAVRSMELTPMVQASMVLAGE